MPKSTRRTFLGSGAATAACALCWPASRALAGSTSLAELDDVAPSAVPEDARHFFLGVAAGDVASTTGVVWTRYDGDRPVRLVVFEKYGSAWRQVARRDLDARGPLHVSIADLQPSTEHRYAFYEMNGVAPVARSRVGRFKTAPTANALVPITLGATCCTMNGRDQSVLAAAGRRRDFDGLLMLGDSVYADGAQTLAEFRKRWWGNIGEPGFQALRSSANMLATWDDHEVHNDWDPETVDPDLLSAAQRAFFEHTPVCHDAGCPDRIWRSSKWGKTVEVFVLDSRTERKRSIGQYLSPEQMTWLKDGLEKSDAMFKVVVNTVPITRFPAIFAGTKRDRWEEYPAQRDDILAFTERLPGVLWLSGDFHLAMIGRASKAGIGSKTHEILAGPGAQMGHALVPWLRGDQYAWASAENNITTLRFDPLKEAIEVSYQGHNGRTFHQATLQRERTGFTLT